MASKVDLSYFEPAFDAEMALTASKVSARIPVLWVIADKDYLIWEGRKCVFDKQDAMRSANKPLFFCYTLRSLRPGSSVGRAAD